MASSSTVPLRVRSPEILLHPTCCIGDCHQNPNSARTESSQGLSLEVSFQISDPPALSHCFVRCHDLAKVTRKNSPSAEEEPFIVAASGGLALLDITFSGDDGIHPPCSDYFVYRAGGGSPSLHLLPGPYPTRYKLNMVTVLPVCDGSDDYAVVFPDVEYLMHEDRNNYTLHIYRSDTRAWSAQVACIAEEETEDARNKLVAAHVATSVVYAGSGLIGWIHLWMGAVKCNVLDTNPTIRFVPVPLNEFYLDYIAEINIQPFRHMTIYNGVIKFIELKYHRGPAFNVKRRDDEAWMATIWTRPISSDVWNEGLTFDTSDIVVTDPGFWHLLPEMVNEKNKLKLDKLMSGGPTLSLNDDHTVYILAKMSLFDPSAFVLALNTRSLMLESCAPCRGENILGFEPDYVPFALFS
ncbi:hypothetical protein ACQ4PT_064734 [Festuca glaucescens]